MSASPVTMQELELERAELLPNRETLCCGGSYHHGLQLHPGRLRQHRPVRVVQRLRPRTAASTTSSASGPATSCSARPVAADLRCANDLRGGAGEGPSGRRSAAVTRPLPPRLGAGGRAARRVQELRLQPAAVPGRAGPTARSSRCPGCCTWWPPRSTAPAALTPSPSWSATTSAGRSSADQVRYLITAKLLPLGIVAGRGAPAAPPKASPLLALRARGTLLPERAANAVGALLRPAVPVARCIAAVVSVAAVDYWLFAVHGLAAGIGQVLRDPAGLLVVFGPVGRLRGVPRVRARGRLPLRRRPARRDRRRHLPGLALVLHQRHRLLPAQPGRPSPHRPRRPVLQPDLHPGPGRSLRGDLGRDPPPRHRRHAPGDAASSCSRSSASTATSSSATWSACPTCSPASCPSWQASCPGPPGPARRRPAPQRPDRGDRLGAVRDPSACCSPSGTCCCTCPRSTGRCGAPPASRRTGIRGARGPALRGGRH